MPDVVHGVYDVHEMLTELGGHVLVRTVVPRKLQSDGRRR